MTTPRAETPGARGRDAGDRAGGDVGLRPGWRRVAEAVAQAVPVGEIARIWLFAPVRQDEREWGTAVIARRVQEGRLRVYTGRYGVATRGRDRGQGQVAVEDVGESPDDVLPEVLRGVQERAGEAEPPVEIAPAQWYGRDEDDESTAPG